MAKAPIYREKGTVTSRDLLARLSEAIKDVDGVAPKELVSELWEAFRDVEKSLRADVTIRRGGSGPVAGYGVSKERKAIACDAIISIVRQIKASKAW